MSEAFAPEYIPPLTTLAVIKAAVFERNVFERGQVRLFVLGLKIRDLPADHAVNCARGMSDLTNDDSARLGRAWDLCKDFVGLGLQGVAGQDGDCLAECLVARRPPTAQIVIVERGQIVMDERIRVQHFERCAELFNSSRQGPGRYIATSQICGAGCMACHASGFHAENGPKALAARKDTVAHGLMNRGWLLGGWWQ